MSELLNAFTFHYLQKRWVWGLAEEVLRGRVLQLGPSIAPEAPSFEIADLAWEACCQGEGTKVQRGKPLTRSHTIDPGLGMFTWGLFSPEQGASCSDSCVFSLPSLALAHGELRRDHPHLLFEPWRSVSRADRWAGRPTAMFHQLRGTATLPPPSFLGIAAKASYKTVFWGPLGCPVCKTIHSQPCLSFP